MKRKIFNLGFVFLIVFVLGSFLLPHITLAETFGPNDPTTAINATGIGTVVWSNPTSVEHSDTSYATVVLKNQEVSNYLKITNYSFAIPLNATILGIQAEISHKSSFHDRIQDQEVEIVKGGNIVGTNEASSTLWPEIETIASYGGDSDLWEQSWTPADINSSDFGLAIAIINNYTDINTNRTASINSVNITVTYSIPTLSSIAISTPATKLDYNVGEVLDITGLEVTGTYSDDSEKVEKNTADNIIGFNSSSPATDQVLTITVNGKTTTYTINIISLSPSPAPTPTPYSITINLKVYSGDVVLFDGPKTVTACAESPEVGASITVNAKCAIEQSGLSNTWIWYDSNLSTISELPKTLGVLNELGGYSSDNMDYIYWGWFSNLNYGSTALNKHTLVNDEELLLTYNSYPLRISASKTSGKVGDKIIFTTEGKNTFNEGWTDMIWTSLAGVTVKLGTQSCTTITDGTCFIILDIAGSLNAIGSKSLYVPSNNIGIEVSNNNSSGGGGNPPILHHKVDIDKALQYLSEKQNSDGSFSSDLYTDWGAIAAGVGDNSNLKTSISNYIKNSPFDSSVATDNERHAMALMSLGINPYSGTEINYIQKIVDAFDGTQFGDSSLVNDDIFALIVLANAGYSSSDEIISKDVKYLLDPLRQPLDGSWGSVDMTSAVIQALKPFSNLNGANEAISLAKNYLINFQQPDGGFNNSSSTSWVLQAIGVLGEDSLTWEKNNLNPNDYLFSLQQTDGGIESLDKSEDTRIWATSYAIPAVMGKSWGDIMQSFQKPVTQNNSSASVLENTDFQKPDITFCPKGDLFSTITGEFCTDVTETNVASINIPTLVQDQNLIKKVVNKKNIETSKIKKVINPEEIQNSLNQDQEISTENNLGASAGNATPIKISFKKIPQTAINFVINTLAYIGKSFYDLIIFLGGSIGAVFG